ncbi:hypothetical protein [Glycomyces buryatensis]|uniref:Uncharacterized protein n=1 Tax=Glycomyces buryatensis TaxID=2570927 RepID=A0A4S8PVV2_9ACTN|nr:hypothetical protein [Glycomyces buryatensis]THV35727.1 hypothetical protein FAB82_22910 [Glycomyces buryatensis]
MAEAFPCPGFGPFEVDADPVERIGVEDILQVTVWDLCVFFGVEAGGESIIRPVPEVFIEVDVAAVVFAAVPAALAARVFVHVLRGGLVAVVVDDQRTTGAGLGDRPAGGVDT